MSRLYALDLVTGLLIDRLIRRAACPFGVECKSEQREYLFGVILNPVFRCGVSIPSRLPALSRIASFRDFRSSAQVIDFVYQRERPSLGQS